mmetsp:Transcript_63460/g.100908  ORF Transcript_63460/g.100908 Transcript_63460/m.100908 type:complete len:190 (-) Transcript_63460:29-598(-)
MERPATAQSTSTCRSGQSVGSRPSRRSAAGSITSNASKVELMIVPPRLRQARTPDATVLPQAGAFSVTGLPGYTGYVPGKVSENVHALTFQKANERAMVEGHLRNTGQVGQVPRIYAGRSFDGPAPGAEVPGYTGFVPGRYANNVIGSTFAKGAELAFLVKNQQMAERLHRVQCYRQGDRPSSSLTPIQ